MLPQKSYPSFKTRTTAKRPIKFIYLRHLIGYSITPGGHGSFNKFIAQIYLYFLSNTIILRTHYRPLRFRLHSSFLVLNFVHKFNTKNKPWGRDLQTRISLQ